MTTTNRILVIPAAGRGVRFQELGKHYPKCILPVNGVPIIVQAIRMLADDTGAFKKVIVVAPTKEYVDAIYEAIAPFNLKTAVDVREIVKGAYDGPAVTLDDAVLNEFSQNGDFDVTVFLSDMLPASKADAWNVVTMPPDNWGVQIRPEGDYKRWCMVGASIDGMTFYDKPEKQPNTHLAACGVYRYASADALLDAMDTLLTVEDFDPKTEMQFSHVATIYNKKHRLYNWVFPRSAFVDFGTLEEYLKNKGLNKSRSFNNVREVGDRVEKTSHLITKIKDEALWMQNIHPRLQNFVPRVVEADLMRGKLVMEKIKSQNLRDVALYLDRSYETWHEIFTKVNTYLDLTRSVTGIYPDDDGYFNGGMSFWTGVYAKTVNRLADFPSDMPSTEYAETWLGKDFRAAMKMAAELDSDPIVYYHGDLHFANMFYCFHYKDMKLVDPRGEMRGSHLYDIAKLAHSVLGRYDYIDSDLYTVVGDNVKFYDKGHNNIEQAFFDVVLDRLSKKEVYIVMELTASLFLSMIPLHADNEEHCRLFYREFVRFTRLAARAERDIEPDIEEENSYTHECYFCTHGQDEEE